MKQEGVKEKTEGKSLRQREREAAVIDDKGWRDKKNWRIKRKNRGTRTWKAQAFMCSVIELEIALYSNLTANFYCPPHFSFTGFIAFSLIFLSSLPPCLPLMFPCAHESDRPVWSRVMNIKVLPLCFCLCKAFRGHVHSFSFLLLLLLNPSSVLHLAPSPQLIICLLMPTHCILYDPPLLTNRDTPLSLYLNFDHLPMAPCVIWSY